MSFLSKMNRGIESFIEFLVFFSRWFQAPIYLGLILGSGLYVYKFMEELTRLFQQIQNLSEVEVMLAILGLIDISMVMNLLIIVIIGGYSIFTSRIDFDKQEDRPHWIDNLDADRLKVKLATSLASISGVHLLKTFIDIHSETKTQGLDALRFEISIHLVFIISALILAWIARILEHKEVSKTATVFNNSVQQLKGKEVIKSE
ncbi:TIGR00645 family protein [Fulvivirgaceae bacterium PWU4]|uniref:UPF0114 protein KK083_31485 n=1 Tax=Chryseosolibacter histidini TaxID=2782349 RepID=A0AAP2DUA7_9BACT|nr:TIGR00645 family protein [Chryseosolibacter histidini]MBT1701458.1 TIGR00645 family protein [Chryseosolibacter histidini]